MARKDLSLGYPLCLAGLVIGLLALVIAAAQGPGYRLGWWGLSTVFRTVYPLVVGLGALAVVMGIITALLRVRYRFKGIALALVGIIAGAAGAAVPVSMRHVAGQLPVIHDITTSTVDPPAFVAIAPLRADASNPVEYAGEPVASQQRDAYPDLQTIRIRQPREQVFEAALAVVAELGWELHASVADEGRIEATERTLWFGFYDDVVIRIRGTDSVTEVDVRSKSRVGQSDLGVNAKRIRIFRDLLLSRVT
ncbi:MAG: DUF1499 domain-containing protein [Xanthomonadales bacterium]|nr:DUF1499 domain-containing protein [Xanthomonadales bacterium]